MKGNQTTSDEARIRDIVESWALAVRRKSLDGAIAHHASDVLLFDVPFPLQSKGIKEYEDSWRTFFPWLDDGGTFELSDLSITAGADVAFCHAIIHCGKPRSSSRKGDLTVRLTICLKKINGDWIVMHEHHSEPAE